MWRWTMSMGRHVGLASTMGTRMFRVADAGMLGAVPCALQLE